MRLRRYQAKALEKLRRMLRPAQRVLAISPTGSGKTVLAAALIGKLRRKRVLWVAHRIELLRQARDGLIASGVPARDVGMLSGTERNNETARVLVASVDMLRHRSVPKVDLIVLDEAHRAQAKSYLAILNSQPKTPTLGLTATPWRLDGQQLTDVFQETLVVSTPTELILEGHIVKPVTYGVPLEKARSMVARIDTTSGDYNGRKLGKAMMRGRLLGDIVSEWERLAKGQPTIVFAVNREHAQAIARRFGKKRRKVAYLDGDTSTEERRRMLNRLRSGELEIIVNVDVLSEGFDCPTVKCVVLARPTKSLTRYLQQTGRASRPYRRQRPIVLDHAGNTWRFGLPESEREWTNSAKRHSAGDAPVRECPECAHVMSASCQTCPECGAELGPTAAERSRLDDERAKLEEIRATEEEKASALIRIREVAKQKGAGEQWVKRVLEAMFSAA